MSTGDLTGTGMKDTELAETGTSDTVTAAAATPDREQPYAALGLTGAEFARIGDILGRRPTDAELAIYSVMWSEHCSYKSSRLHLRRLPTEGPRVLVGPGENAGVIDAGDGGAFAPNSRRYFLDDLYEQCSLHMTE